MLQYCEKQKKKVMFIHVVHAFPIDFWTDLKKKKMLLYEVILTVECFYFVISL